MKIKLGHLRRIVGEVLDEHRRLASLREDGRLRDGEWLEDDESEERLRRQEREEQDERARYAAADAK